MPLMTLKVVAGIHWEALKLWLKGIGLRTRPARRKPPAITTERPSHGPSRSPQAWRTAMMYADDRHDRHKPRCASRPAAVNIDTVGRSDQGSSFATRQALKLAARIQCGS